MDSRCSACLSAIYTNHAPGCPLIDSREMRAYEIRQGDFPFVKPTDCVVDRPAAPKPESPTTPLILTMDAPGWPQWKVEALQNFYAILRAAP